MKKNEIDYRSHKPILVFVMISSFFLLIVELTQYGGNRIVFLFFSSFFLIPICKRVGVLDFQEIASFDWWVVVEDGDAPDADPGVPSLPPDGPVVGGIITAM